MSVSLKKHCALLTKENVSLQIEPFLVKQGYLKPTLGKQKKQISFSSATLRNMIEEESKRDTSIVFERENQTLRSMSSGERKVALLKYLISLAPNYLLIENFYDNLDKNNQGILEGLLINASEYISIIQIVNKQSELLPFITNLYFSNAKKQLVPYKKDSNCFFRSEPTLFSKFSIPQTTTKYNYKYQTFIKLTNVAVHFFDKPILKAISWEIKLGEFWQLIGANGTGKTTLLSLITGDSHKAYGQNIVLFDKLKGTEENVWEIKQKIGYFTPNITELFNKRHSVLHMVLSGFYDSIGLYVKPLDIHIKLAKQWLELIEMTSFTNTTFSTLTATQQRMVLIVRAMVKHPPLLILDEPTSGLNAKNISIIVALINKISKETNTAIIYVSHSVEDGLHPKHIYKLNQSSYGSTGGLL